jgi:hypothetical protein
MRYNNIEEKHTTTDGKKPKLTGGYPKALFRKSVRQYNIEILTKNKE